MIEPADRARLMKEGLAAFNRGEFYEAHEFWEEVWMEIDDPDWTWIQGLIQIATGLHKASRARWESALRSLSRGLGRLDDAPDALDGIDVAAARQLGARIAAAIEAGDKPSVAGLHVPSRA